MWTAAATGGLTAQDGRLGLRVGNMRHVASFSPHAAPQSIAPHRTARGVNEPYLNALVGRC